MSIQVKDANGATQTVNSLPATGQATSANSLPVVIASDQSALSVSWSGQSIMATQSGAWSVSLAGTPSVSISESVAVTGTFWPATQPVSGAAPAGSPPTTSPLSVSGVDGSGNKQHLKVATDGTLAASLASLPALPAGSNVIGGVTTPVSAPQTGAKAVATTGTAVSLGSGALANGVVITANPANTATILVGPSGVANVATSSANGYALAPGASISIAAANLNQIYINGAANDFVFYAGN